MSNTPQFAIGTKFIKRNAPERVYTIIDIITWTNAGGVVVGRRYVAECVGKFGQKLRDSNVLETTILMGSVVK